MLHASTQKLIDRLAEMTERGRLGWGQDGNDSVIYVTEGYSVTVTAEPHEFIIASKEGKELERATVSDLKETPSLGSGTYEAVLATMHRQASRIARGTEAAISSLLADIETEDTDTALSAPSSPAFETSQPEDLVNESEPVEAGPPVLAPEEPEQSPAEAAEQTDAEGEVDAVSETESVETETEPETDAVDEFSAPIMTQAVARLADEVNQQTDDSEDKSATSETETVTETLTDAEPAEEIVETAEVETQADPQPDVETASPEQNDPVSDAETEGTASPETAIEPEGVDLEPEFEQAPETEVEIEPVIAAEVEAEDQVTETAPSIERRFEYTPFGLDADVDLPGSPDQLMESLPDTKEDLSEPAPEASAEASGEVSDTSAPETPFQPDEATEPAIDIIEDTETEAEDTSEDMLQMLAAAPAPILSLVETDEPEEESVPATDNVVDFVSTFSAGPLSAEEETSTEQEETETPVSPELTTPAPETPELSTEDRDPSLETGLEAETPTLAEPKEDTLSPVGTGFGLGTVATVAENTEDDVDISFKTSEPEPERIIIDAVDDVPLEPKETDSLKRTADPLPDLASLDAPEVEKAPVQDAAEADAASDDEDPLKPKTRFNPWN